MSTAVTCSADVRSSTGGSTGTNGCTTGSLPEGSAVTISGATRPGKLAYNSWIVRRGVVDMIANPLQRMQRRGETDADTCAYNDLALVEVRSQTADCALTLQVDPADYSRVNPVRVRLFAPFARRSDSRCA